MNRAELDKRLRDLGLYSEYYMRKELKPLAELLDCNASLNCILTGVHDANRKLLAVTDRELLVIFTGALANGEVKVISRKAVTSWNFEKKFFMPAVEFTAEGETYRFTNTQRGRRELFEWAMNQPL